MYIHSSMLLNGGIYPITLCQYSKQVSKKLLDPDKPISQVITLALIQDANVIYLKTAAQSNTNHTIRLTGVQ